MADLPPRYSADLTDSRSLSLRLPPSDQRSTTTPSPAPSSQQRRWNDPPEDDAPTPPQDHDSDPLKASLLLTRAGPEVSSPAGTPSSSSLPCLLA